MTIHQDGPLGHIISGDENHCTPHPAYEAMLEKIRTNKATIDGMDVKADVEAGGLRITISGTDYSASGSENG